MKTKILIGVISFIFLSVFSVNVFATTDGDIENVIIDDIINEEECDIEQEKTNNNQFEIIEEVSENIETKINEENNNIEVGTIANYRGVMCLDTPGNNITYTRPDVTSIEFNGWAVSTDDQASVRIYLDGGFLANCSRSKRVDVDNIVSPGYGGASVTPNAGFNYKLDINNLSQGSHTVKIEEISRYGEVLASNSLQINVVNKKYNGAMCIDTPGNNITYARPDVTSIEFNGWAVSTDSQASIRIYLDGGFLANCSRSKRVDVDNIVSPGYGGVSVTPNAGFNYKLDISNLSQGNHTVKIEEISRYGEVLASNSLQINVVNKNFSGAMCVDTPTNASSFEIPRENKIRVSGWAVSNDSESILKLYVNDVYWTNISQNVNRSDLKHISEKYGNITDITKAGFNYDIDVNLFPIGEHSIRIDQVSRYGNIISSTNTKIKIISKKYSGAVCIDNPIYCQEFIKQDINQIKIEGWAVSTDSNSNIRVLFDGNIISNEIKRIKRTDVDILVSPSYGGISATPNAGFQTEININSHSTGKHSIRIEEISRHGELICASETVVVLSNHKYLGEMCLDDPIINGSFETGKNLIVSGWAVAEDENAYVEIYIDGVLKAIADRYYREDIVPFMQRYGNKTINSGFGKLISTTNLSVGMHKITVYEKSRYGEIIGGIERNFTLRTNQVSTNLTVSSTTNNQNSTIISSNNSVSQSVEIKTAGTMGIDVSQFQGNIDWKSVAQSGVKYAMIRIGYRGYGTGGFAEDTKFKSNFANAVANGIKVGVYFYSTSINVTEAKKDAEYVMQILQKYGYQNKVSMPIAIDLELVSGVNTRDINVSKQTRTNIANTFCNTIAGYGYTPMIYACKSFLNDNMYKNQILYDVWVAQYSSNCTYSGKYTIWQYTSSGKVSGISGNVDCNYCYKNY